MKGTAQMLGKSYNWSSRRKPGPIRRFVEVMGYGFPLPPAPDFDWGRERPTRNRTIQLLSLIRGSLSVLSLTWIPCFLAAPVQAAELVFDLRVERGRVPEAMRVIRVNQGDLVRLRWSVDRPTALHLHGYDVEQTIAPGAIGEVIFSARSAGQFPLYIAIPDRRGGHSHEEPPLVVLEVQPR
jgi:hypothetical protein